MNEHLAASSVQDLITLCIDNIPNIHRIKREGSSNAQQVVDIGFHALKQAWIDGDIALEYIPIGENAADLLTKALPISEHRHKRGLCGLITTTDVVQWTSFLGKMA